MLHLVRLSVGQWAVRQIFKDICDTVHGALHAVKNSGIGDLGHSGSGDLVASR